MTVNVSVPIDEVAKGELDAWAEARGISLDSMLAEAVAAFIADRRELDAAIAEGLADIDAGKVVDHDAVAKRLRDRRFGWISAE